MKKVLTTLLLLAGMFMNAQTFGATALNVKGTIDAAKPAYGQWMRQGTSNRATTQFAQTSAGVSEALTLVEGMLAENGLVFDSPDIYKSVEGKDLTSKNPEVLNNSIQKGNSKINLAWNAKDGSTLQLLLSKNSYEVTVMNAYK